MKSPTLPNKKELSRKVEGSLAKTGIVALVDEATGYQYERPTDALVKLFAGYIDKDLEQWCARIPVRFWRDLFRLLGTGLERKELVDRAGEIVEFVKRFVFEALPWNVHVEMREAPPKPRVDEALAAALKRCGLEELVGTGIREFDHQVITVGAFLRVATTVKEFEGFVKMADGEEKGR